MTEPAGLDRLAHIGSPARLLTHRLMNIEAQALTGAMDNLRVAHDVLALPMHDGLLVPRSAASHARASLIAAFSYFANGVRIRCKMDTADDAALD